ncbi:MAG: DUF5103 domain-containing protein [Myroides sp.]|nr:DUF5103 domain-containing protein [Myroides sp.]
MKKIIAVFIYFISILNGFSSTDPYYLKSVAFSQGNESLIPIFKLNERFHFSFDDLMGSETDYYYKIIHCDRNWKPSNLNTNEYLSGIQNARITTYQTSFNTLQAFVNYQLTIPNRETKILISGNYLLEIYDVNSQKVLQRRFVIYEDVTTVGVEVKRTRDLKMRHNKQNVYLNIDFGSATLQNPKKNINVVLLQNGQWYNALQGLAPQYVLGNSFTYQYDEETNFWAGNEFLYFDNSDIKQVNNNIERITRRDLFDVFLRPKAPLRNSNYYSYYEDLNGAFAPRNILRSNHTTEADYTWMYFTYHLEKLPNNQKLHIVGMFNDYQISPDSELDFNDELQAYTTALLLKQGFVNYKYVIVNSSGKVLEELNPDGNYVETENVYHALVYYKADSDRYERIIGLGKSDSKLITN